ncbi:MAG TPA: type 1 glutamine amidotransferase [Patescibacteria group bacterium]|nr:type 1 glutamine amidotransferase [Patescibacteria group bacterium]
MSQAIRALIVQHEEPTPPGLLLEWLNSLKAQVDIHRIDLETNVPDARDYDLIASLGSEFPAFDDSVPFIERETRLIREAAEADVPFLGLCFGGQLMARVLGGKSFRAERSEIGWLNVRSTNPDLIDSGPWFQWHFDTFSLPPGATLLADTDVGPQAYMIGRNLGLQFHPEVTPEIMDLWVRSYRHELDGDGVDPDALLAETNERAPEVRRRSLRLFDRFLNSIAKVKVEASRGG